MEERVYLAYSFRRITVPETQSRVSKWQVARAAGESRYFDPQ